MILGLGTNTAKVARNNVVDRKIKTITIKKPTMLIVNAAALEGGRKASKVH